MEKHVCPWYLGYFLASPLRRLAYNPEKILSSYVTSGMKILEIGPGMGFFSLPLARLVGETGQIICIDLQEKMLQGLRRRAAKANLLTRIKTRLCTESSFMIEDLKGSIDFALAFAVVHEVPDQKHLLVEIHDSLKKGGLLLLSEPKGAVDREQFDKTLSIAQGVGFRLDDTPEIRSNLSAVFKKLE